MSTHNGNDADWESDFLNIAIYQSLVTSVYVYFVRDK